MGKYCKLVFILSITLISCKKESTDIKSGNLLLSKVEIVFLSQASQLNKPTSDDPPAQNFFTYTYDEKGRLLSEQYSNLGSQNSVVPNTASFLEYGEDGKINKIKTIKPSATYEYFWKDKTVNVHRVFDDGHTSDAVLTLNDAGLFIKRTEGAYSVDIEYDTRGNVTRRWEGNVLKFEAIEYDTTKLDPRSSSYELRILNSLVSIEGFLGRSRNVLTKSISSGDYVENRPPYISEYNAQNYPIVIGSLAYGVTRTKYTYIMK